jgi:hypothetical protein
MPMPAATATMGYRTEVPCAGVDRAGLDGRRSQLPRIAYCRIATAAAPLNGHAGVAGPRIGRRVRTRFPRTLVPWTQPRCGKRAGSTLWGRDRSLWACRGAFSPRR